MTCEVLLYFVQESRIEILNSKLTTQNDTQNAAMI
jgi:hypothetical protein